MPATKKTAQKSASKKSAKKTASKKTAAAAKTKKADAPKSSKKTVKRAAPKKKASRAPVRTSCPCTTVCKAEEAFWVNNGPVVHSVAELKVVLGELSNEQFEYHTKRAGNDFACWLRDCLGDAATAERLEKARGRSGALRALSCSC